MAKAAKAPSLYTGKSLEDFQALHDKNFIVPKKIREALVKLGASWCTEVEFLKLASISTTEGAMFREQFKDFYVEVDSSKKRVWAGTKAYANTLRAKLS